MKKTTRRAKLEELVYLDGEMEKSSSSSSNGAKEGNDDDERFQKLRGAFVDGVKQLLAIVMEEAKEKEVDGEGEEGEEEMEEEEPLEPRVQFSVRSFKSLVDTGEPTPFANVFPPFQVLDDFDFSKTTLENYEGSDKRREWHQKFVEEKSLLMKRHLGIRWAIFLFGEGNQHVLNLLSKEFNLALKNFIFISKIQICFHFPEWDGYLKKLGDIDLAIQKCVSEAENLEREVINRCKEIGQNVLIHCVKPPTKEEISEFGGFRIAVFHVLATKATIQRRSGMPVSVTSGDTIEAAETEARMMSDSIPFGLRVFVNDDSDNYPKLYRVDDRTPMITRTISRHFSSTDNQSRKFPHCLQSLFLEPTTLGELISTKIMSFQFLKPNITVPQESDGDVAVASASKGLDIQFEKMELADEPKRMIGNEGDTPKKKTRVGTMNVLVTMFTSSSSKAFPSFAKIEAENVMQIISSADESQFSVKFSDDNGPSQLIEDLRGVHCWHILTRTGDTSSIETGSGELLADLVVSSVLANEEGILELIVISGPRGEDIASRLVSECQIPFVIYWDSLVDEEAACEFAIGFWKGVCSGASYETAMKNAITYVETKMQVTFGSSHQKFKMQVDPQDLSKVIAEGKNYFLIEDVNKFDSEGKPIPRRRPAGRVLLAKDETSKIAKGKLSLIANEAELKDTIFSLDGSNLIKFFETIPGKSIEWATSPLSPVNLDILSREMAAIPENATQFAWAYPSKIPLSGTFSENNHDVDMFRYGAYLYFDNNEKLLAANMVSIIGAGADWGVDFEPPELLPYEDAQELSAQGRWYPVTLPSMLAEGAKYFCWICPEERLATRIYPKYGSFAYLFRGKDAEAQHPLDRIFPVGVKSILQ